MNLGEMISIFSAILTKSFSLLVIKSLLVDNAVAKIIASGNLIFPAFLISITLCAKFISISMISKNERNS